LGSSDVLILGANVGALQAPIVFQGESLRNVEGHPSSSRTIGEIHKQNSYDIFHGEIFIVRPHESMWVPAPPQTQIPPPGGQTHNTQHPPPSFQQKLTPAQFRGAHTKFQSVKHCNYRVQLSCHSLRRGQHQLQLRWSFIFLAFKLYARSKYIRHSTQIVPNCNRPIGLFG